MTEVIISPEELAASQEKINRLEKSNPNRVIESKAEYPDIEVNGKRVKVLDTSRNLSYLLDKFNAKVRMNMMSRMREVDIPGFFISNDDRENAALNVICDLATVNYFPISRMDNHLDLIAQSNAYHPIVDHLKKNPWDGEYRLREFIKTLKTTNEEFTRELVTAWMVCAIAAAHSRDGFTNSGVLVLQGGQGIGKTTWIRRLDPIGCRAVKDGAFLNPTEKDSVSQLASYWIAELGEIECIFNKQEIGRLKSFITMDSDFIRLPFARRSSNIPRRTVYAATVNEANYLVDETGNRRWWTIPVTGIDYKHSFDMTQVWAEVYDMWKNGYPTYLTAELQAGLNEANKEFEKIDDVKERLLAHYDWDDTRLESKTAFEIAQAIGIKDPHVGHLRRVSNFVQELSGKPQKKMLKRRYVFVPLSLRSPSLD